MKITLLDIGLFLICLFYSYAILEFVQRREKYSILLVGNFIIGLFLFVILHAPIVYILKVLGIGLAAAMVLYILLNLGKSEKKGKRSDKSYTGDPIKLKTKDGDTIKYYEPLENFLVYGGANAGKTASLGKPLLLEYLKLGYCSFVYDAKEFDYSKTIYGYYNTHEQSSNLFYVNFNDPNKSHRFNPTKPSLFNNSTHFEEVNEQFLRSLKGLHSKDDEWWGAALGLYKGISWMFFKHFPELCTWPHIANFFLHRETSDLVEFLNSDNRAKGYASAFLKVQDSERTLASIQFNLSNYLSKIANNEALCYILTGNDFEYNFVNPEKPISFCVCNSHQISNTLSPVIGALVNIAAKQFDLTNKNPLLFCLDEATTFHIPNFEGLPSLLREFKVAFLMLTQSSSKIEKLYGKLDLNSIHSNFTNKFFGKTGDVNAVKDYQQLFEKVMNEYTSESRNYGQSYSEGTTMTKRKEFKFEADFFSHLQPGEFVGIGGQSNYIDFHKRFVPYDRSLDMEPRTVREKIVTAADLDENLETIINEVKSISI